MQYLKTYLKTIADRGNPQLAESIAKTADEVGNRHIKNFSFCSHEMESSMCLIPPSKTSSNAAMFTIHKSCCFFNRRELDS